MFKKIALRQESGEDLHVLAIFCQIMRRPR